MNWALQIFEQTHSTQNVLRDLAAQGSPEFTAVQALEQTQGRGRHGRAWVSEKGNLFLSLLLHPECEVKDTGILALMIGVSVGKALQSFMADPEKLVLKWPNDVLIEGKKCAGILLDCEQGAGLSVLAGIGVNIISAPPEGARLRDYAGASLDEVRDKILEQAAQSYDLWRNEGSEPIRESWKEMTYKEGTGVTVKVGDRTHEGSFHDIDARGSLLLRDNKGRAVTITAGDVYMNRMDSHASGG